jgi:hypothetical protein
LAVRCIKTHFCLQHSKARLSNRLDIQAMPSFQPQYLFSPAGFVLVSSIDQAGASLSPR